MLDPQAFTLSHTLATEARKGVLYTEGDSLLPQGGDLDCSEGVPLVGVETMNFSMGTGDYEGLVDGTIQLHGVVNNCSGQSEYLQNNFTVIPGVGGIRFKPPGASDDHTPGDGKLDAAPLPWLPLGQ